MGYTAKTADLSPHSHLPRFSATAASSPPQPESEDVLRERMGKLLDGDGMTELERQLSVIERWIKQEQARRDGKEVELAEGEEPVEKPHPRSLIFLSEAFLQNLLKVSRASTCAHEEDVC